MIAVQKGSTVKVPVRLFSLLDYVTPITGVAPTQDIEDITLSGTDPVAITITGHGLSTYMTVLISDVVGTTELNGNVYTVTYVDADNFTLVGTDSSAFSAYTSGGKINEVDILISKAGGVPAAPSDGAWAELATATDMDRGNDGTYTVSLNATDTNTEGPLTVHVDCGRAAKAVVALWVVDWTVMGGGATAQEVWEYSTRTLTEGGGGGGATAQEVWEYEERTLTQEIAADAPTVEEIDARLSNSHGAGLWEISALTVEDIDTYLTAQHGEGSWQTGEGGVPVSPGTGDTPCTYTLTTEPEGVGTPIADAKVWVTTDVAGTNVVASGYTNDSGKVTFWLDSGVTYYVWRSKAGMNFTNPDTEVA